MKFIFLLKTCNTQYSQYIQFLIVTIFLFYNLDFSFSLLQVYIVDQIELLWIQRSRWNLSPSLVMAPSTKLCTVPAYDFIGWKPWSTTHISAIRELRVIRALRIVGQTDHVAVECVSREIILITVIYQTAKNVAMTSFRIFYYTAFFLLLYVFICFMLY